MTDSLALHQLALQHNWDDGFDVPRQLLDHDCCELATALTIFFDADGDRYLDEDHAHNDRLPEWSAFIERLHGEITSGKYPRGRLGFEPPLTAVQLFTLRKRLSDEDRIFVEPFEGTE